MKAVFLILALLVGQVVADGISMTKDFRFTHDRESCYTLKLTPRQVAFLESKREGDKPLYVQVDLNKDQSTFLKGKTGKDISKLLVFENGWNDCGCCAQNIASRFKPDQVEVCDSFLYDDGVLRRWEKKREEAAAAAEAKKAATKAEE